MIERHLIRFRDKAVAIALHPNHDEQLEAHFQRYSLPDVFEAELRKALISGSFQL